MGWIEQELDGIDLKDARLENRLKKLIEQFSEKPDASIPKACEDWAGAKAAYRFFDNSKVSHRAIMDSHRQATVQRVEQNW